MHKDFILDLRFMPFKVLDAIDLWAIYRWKLRRSLTSVSMRGSNPVRTPGCRWPGGLPGKSHLLHWFSLAHICLMDFSILINWTSPFRILGVSGVLFHFYSILNRNSCKQTVKTLIWPDLGLHCLPRYQKWDTRLIERL